jgi:hypothetical protein
MKKLQNNFTTQEQSKRLLELGLPADSADCVAHIVDNSIDLHEDFFLKGDTRISVINQRHTYTKVTTLKDNEAWLDEPYPCWSVGRLIEIYHICVSPGCSFTFHVCFPNLMNEIMYKLSEANCNGWLNLSKLEESYV